MHAPFWYPTVLTSWCRNWCGTSFLNSLYRTLCRDKLLTSPVPRYYRLAFEVWDGKVQYIDFLSSLGSTHVSFLLSERRRLLWKWFWNFYLWEDGTLKKQYKTWSQELGECHEANETMALGARPTDRPTDSSAIGEISGSDGDEREDFLLWCCFACYTAQSCRNWPSFQRRLLPHHCHDDGNCKHLRNFGQFLPY